MEVPFLQSMRMDGLVGESPEMASIRRLIEKA